MSEIIKKYGVLINIAIVLLIAYSLSGLVGKGVATFVVSRVNMPAFKVKLSQHRTEVHRKTGRVSRDSYRVILDRNIFDVKVSDEAPEPQEEVVTETPLKLKLLGVIVSNDPQKSMAIIQDGNTNKTDIYMVHDKVQGAEIIEIKKDSVILKRGGKKEVLYLYENLKSGPARVATRRGGLASKFGRFDTGQPNRGKVDLEIREVANNTYEVNKEDFDQLTNNLGSILTQARVVPYFKNGKIEGYKIFSIRPNGVFAKIGLRNGDIIKSVNGETLESPEKALQLFQFLKTEDSFRIVLERNGREMTLTYRLR